MKHRAVSQVVRGLETSDGAGVRLKRSIGTRVLDHLDPFLLLDEIRSDRPDDYVAGFPDHPHRGFETVTYMLAGAMEHRDHEGHSGRLGPGSVQWMTAGRGIVHSETPRQSEGLLWGFQLWVNLPAREKMSPPRYQEFAAEAIPEVRRADGTRVRVVAGTCDGVEGAVKGIATSPLYLDVSLPSGVRFEQEVPAGHNACAYVFEGEGDLGLTEDGSGRKLEAGHLAVLGDGDRFVAAGPRSAVRFLLLAARPLGEPVARYGPFVMNTQEEVMQAVRDYQEGTLAR